MTFYLSTFYEPDHPKGHVGLDREPFANLKAVIDFVELNCVRCRPGHESANVRFSTEFQNGEIWFMSWHRPTVTRVSSASRGQLARVKNFNILYDVTDNVCEIHIESAERAGVAWDEEAIEGNNPKPLSLSQTDIYMGVGVSGVAQCCG